MQVLVVRLTKYFHLVEKDKFPWTLFKIFHRHKTIKPLTRFLFFIKFVLLKSTFLALEGLMTNVMDVVKTLKQRCVRTGLKGLATLHCVFQFVVVCIFLRHFWFFALQISRDQPSYKLPD